MVRIVLLAVLTLVTTGLYLNSFPGSFHYDDYPLLLENPLITGEAFPLSTFWSHYWGRPLTLATFRIEYSLFGSDPFFFHLANYLLHLCVVVLLFFVVRRYIGGDGLAFSTALIFAVHPVQSQAVNYVWSRSVLLMAVFVLLTLLVWRRFPLLGLIIAQLAIWSRAEGVVLGLLLILLMPRWWKWVSVLIGANLAILAGALWRDSGAGVGWNHSDPVSYWLASPAVRKVLRSAAEVIFMAPTLHLQAKNVKHVVGYELCFTFHAARPVHYHTWPKLRPTQPGQDGQRSPHRRAQPGPSHTNPRNGPV